MSAAKRPASHTAAIRKIALSLPEVTEVETWDLPTFRVRNKMLAIVADDGSAASIKATLDEQQALIGSDPGTYSVAPFVGRHGWVLCQLATTPVGVLEDLLTEAWRLTAPKRLVRSWDEGESGQAR